MLKILITIFLSLLMSTFFIFIEHIYAKDITTFTDEDLQKYHSKSSLDTERVDEPQTSEQNNDKMGTIESPQEQTVESKINVSEAEKNVIVSHCIQIWHRYKTALSKGDIEGALQDVSDNSKESFRNALQSKRTAEQLGTIEAESIENTIARFKMSAKVKLRPDDSIPPGYSVGDSIVVDAYVVFIKDPHGKWKIDFY